MGTRTLLAPSALLALLLFLCGCGEQTPIEKLDAQTRLLLEENRLGDAIEEVEKALADAANTLGPTSPGLVPYLERLATLCTQAEQYGEAEDALRRIVAIDEATFGMNHPRLIAPLRDLVKLHDLSEGQYGSVEAKRRALDIFRAQPVELSAWAMLAVGVVVLYGGLTWCLTITVRRRARAAEASSPSAQ